MEKQLKAAEAEKKKLSDERKKAFRVCYKGCRSKGKAEIKNTKAELIKETRQLNIANQNFEKAKKKVDAITNKIEDLKASFMQCM